MKKLLHLTAGFTVLLCIGGTATAQEWNGAANTTGDIYRSGRVGIGTTVAPTQMLQVSGGNVILDYASGANGNLYFGGITGSGQNGMRMFYLPTGSVPGGFIDVRCANPTEGLKFRVDNNIGGIERMRICANGNIGIGTLAPSQRLHVHNGAIKISGTVPGYGGPMILFGSANADGSGIEQWGIEYMANSGLNFWKPFGSPNAGNYYLFLADNGDIGVRTNTPAYNFDVNGNGRFSTSLLVNGGALTGASLSSYSATGNALATWAPGVNGAGGYLEGLHVGTYGLAGFHTSGGPNPVEAIGVWGLGGPLGSNKGVGVHGDGQGGQYSVGIWGQATSGTLGTYGVWGDVASGLGWAGYFSGDVYAAGAYFSSDKKLKQNIEEIGDAMSILNRLNAYTYDFRTSEFPGMNLPEGRQYGLISQEVKEVLPTLVKKSVQPERFDDEGNVVTEKVEFEAVNYVALIPLLIEGMKEQQKEIEELKTELLQLREAHSETVELSVAARLDQNAPNPFNRSTVIRYFLPESVTDASLVIYDMNGVLIKTVPLRQKGEGRIVIEAGELNSGTYTYSMITDGMVVSSYKMVLTQ